MTRVGIGISVFAALAPAAFAQDMQVSARAKGMGGSYTAFGDDPIAIWQNPAGTATQESKFALSYQSFVTYEFADGADAVPGEPQATLNETTIQPSFIGMVVKLGEEKLKHAFSVGFVNPINTTLTWTDGSAPNLLTEHESSRFRIGYAIDLNLVESGKGWFTHIAVGGGMDWGSTTYEDSAGAKDRESRFGGGFGLLTTIFTDGDFSVDLGLSFNTKLDFDFNLPGTGASSVPIIDWPAEASIGIAIYISRLKITAAVQKVEWKDAVAASAVAGHSSFEDTENTSVGIEYTLHISEKVVGFVRAGARSFDAPWEEDSLVALGTESSLPVAVDQWGLSINTDEEEFDLVTVGGGIYWTADDGKKRGFDFGVEIGGDKATLAIGYVHEF